MISLVDPRAQVSVESIEAALDAFALVPRFASILLARHEIDLQSPPADGFFPLARWIAALADIEREVGPATVRAIGASVARVLSLPASCRAVEDALDALPYCFQELHRGPAGRLGVSTRDDGARLVTSSTSYPREHVFGLLEGTCVLPLARARRFVVTHDGARWVVVGR